MPAVLAHRRHDDAELARRVAAGDDAAFPALDRRYRATLVRYAGSLVRRSEHDAEDIVQDVLIALHAALRAGKGPDELRPWLYRLTRNRAIDEVRRKRWGEEALGSDELMAGDSREDPDAVLRRKEAVRRLVEDLADLPVRQREALIAREVDGESPERVAAQLGVSVAAAQKLAMRARENLIKVRDARDADCDGVRAMLLDACERGVRPTEHGLRHLKSCDACRAYRRDTRRLSRQLQALNPSLAWPLFAAVAKFAGSGGGKLALGAGAALVIATTGGVLVTAAKEHGAGDPAPFRFKSTNTGRPIPKNVAVVTARAQIAAGAPDPGQPRSLTLACPKGMKYDGLASDTEQRADIQWNPDPGALPGNSTRVRIVFSDAVLPRAVAVDVGIACRKPASNGSMVAGQRLPKPGERSGRMCARTEYLRRTPAGIVRGTAYRGEPLSIQRRSASGVWTQVVLDTGYRGWIRTSSLCG
jgi:RNA polymerase sigma factor (sigma-70 family)